MVQQQHGQAGFMALLSAASDGRAEGAHDIPAQIHGTPKPKRSQGITPGAGERTQSDIADAG